MDGDDELNDPSKHAEMTPTIFQGENFLLNLTLLNDDSSPVLESSLKSFEIKARNYRRLLKDWLWLPDDAGDEHITIVDGLAQLEVESDLTENWLGTIDFEVIPSFTDNDYFVSDAQTDVVCLDKLLVVQRC